MAEKNLGNFYPECVAGQYLLNKVGKMAMLIIFCVFCSLMLGQIVAPVIISGHCDTPSTACTLFFFLVVFLFPLFSFFGVTTYSFFLNLFQNPTNTY